MSAAFLLTVLFNLRDRSFLPLNCSAAATIFFAHSLLSITALGSPLFQGICGCKLPAYLTSILAVAPSKLLLFF